MSTTTPGRVGPAARRRLTSLLRPLAVLGLLLATAGAAQAQTTTSFAYTGGPQTYTVPAGVTRLQVVATGASGGGGLFGRSAAGRGAQVQATVPVTPGEMLTVVVGGQGRPTSGEGQVAGGYNGGGGGENTATGGGATDLRRAAGSSTGDYLSSRNALLVAGGGGGGGLTNGGGSAGGNGGTPIGSKGGDGTFSAGGGGGTQTVPGAGGSGFNSSGSGGSGRGGSGGGGYYGGGSGGFGSSSDGGGGGGSSWATAGATGVSYTLASAVGNGTLTITPILPLTITSLAPTPNAVVAPASSPVQVTFNQTLASSSASALQVFSAQRGGRRTGATPATVSGNQLTFTPSAYPYKPGEVVSATVTTAAQSTGGGQLATPRVFQFTAATGGSGRGGFGGGSDPAVGNSPNSVTLGDVNGDGFLDLLTANTLSNNVSVRFNNGQGAFGGGSEVSVSNGPFSVVLGDVNGDGYLDLLTANTNSNNVSVRLGNGQGSFGGGSDPAVGNSPTSVVLGDVDGDGDLDLLTVNTNFNTLNGGTVSVRLNDGQGAFSGSQEVPTNGNPQGGLALGDVDGDGDLDVLAGNNNGGSVAVRLNDGQGTFSGSQNVAVGGNVYGVAVGDLDADGDLDFVTANYGGSGSVRLNNGQGSFSGSQSVAVNGIANSVALGDVDGDGDLDFVTANGGTPGSVSVRFNLAAPTLTSLSPSSGPVGTRVTVTGTNFASASTVSFNGTAATAVTVTSLTSLTATVPTGTTSGNVTVTTASGTSNGLVFTVRTAPVANNDAYTLDTNSAGYAVAAPGVLTNDAPAPGTSLTAQLVRSPTRGQLTLNPDGSFTYTPAPDYAGTDSFQYQACDNGAPSLCSNVATVTLTVQAVAPTVTTAAPQNVASTSATLGGTVRGEGGAAVATRGVVYSSSNSQPTLGGNATTTAANGSGPGSFAAAVTSLLPSTTYYVRAYATNSAGTGYGSALSFTTTAPATTAAPVLTSPAANSTTNGLPTFAGTAPASSTVTIYLAMGSGAAQVIGTTTATLSNGSFSFTPATALSTGTYAVYATAQASGQAVSANSNTNTFTVDATSPTATLSTTASGSTSTSPIPFAIAFSEAVTGLSASSFVVTNGTVTSGSLAGSGTSFSFSVTPTGNGLVSVSLPANAVQDGVGNGNTASNNVSVQYTAPVASGLSVLYQTGDLGQPADGQVRPFFQLVNSGASAVPYSQLTVRYWLTVENFKGQLMTPLDYAKLGTSFVSARYVQLATPRQGAFGYIEYSFAAGAGSLNPGSDSGPIYGKAYKPDYSSLDETDDWSYQTSSAFTANSHVTLYQNGTLLAGTEPAAVTATTALQVLAASRDNAASTQFISVQLQVRNTGTLPVSYGDVRARYYFTRDGASTVVAELDYAKLGNNNVSLRVVNLPAAVSGADAYVEVTFSSALGVFYPRTSTDDILFKLRKDTYQAFDQTNDYSFTGSTALALNPRFTAYVGNQLVFGTPPSGNTATRSAASLAPASANGATIVAATSGPLALTASPNPFGEQLTLRFALPTAQAYTLAVYDGQGRLVQQLASGRAEAEQAQEVAVPTQDYATGLYLVRLTSADGVQTLKLVKR